MTYPQFVEPATDDEGVENHDWRKHLKIALKDLSLKKLDIDKQWRYYEGNHPKVWLTEKLRLMFKDLADQMSDNWCEPAIDQVLARLEVDNFNSESDAARETQSKAAWNTFKDNDLPLGQNELYRHSLVAGEGFALGWYDDDDFPDITIVDPRHVWWPECDKRTAPSRVVYVWKDEDEEFWRATCYYERDCVRLIGPKVSEHEAFPTDVAAFREDPIDPGGPHGFDRVPWSRFSLQKKRKPRLRPVIPVQDKINKLESNKMVAAEFGAFRQRYALTKQVINDGDLEARPDRAIVLDPGGDQDTAPTQVGTFEITELENYDGSIEKQIDKFFSLLTMPRHLRVTGTSQLESGDAIEADEGPFINYIRQLQQCLGAGWVDLLSLFGIDAEPQWRDPRISGDKAKVDTVKSAVEAGVHISVALKKYGGWGDDEIKEMEERPLTPQEQMGMLGQLATATALGGVAPEHANEMSAKITGRKPDPVPPKPQQQPPAGGRRVP